MGFNIGALIGSIAPALGGILGGLPGAIIGTGIAAGLSSPVGRSTAVATRAPQIPASSVVPTTASRISLQSLPSAVRSGFAAGPVLRSAGQIAGGAAGFSFLEGLFANGNGQSELSQILARARENSPGATKKKIIAAAKACGIDLAADTFGLSAREICVVIVSGTTRRRRGVSAADIRRTKRTLRFVSSLRKDLKKIKA